MIAIANFDTATIWLVLPILKMADDGNNDDAKRYQSLKCLRKVFLSVFTFKWYIHNKQTKERVRKSSTSTA